MASPVGISLPRTAFGIDTSSATSPRFARPADQRDGNSPCSTGGRGHRAGGWTKRSWPTVRRHGPALGVASPLGQNCPVVVRWALVALTIAVAVPGCSGNARRDTSAANDEAYALQQNPSWKLQEAIDPRPEDPIAANDRPPMDWYAEYVRSDHTVMVRLSGHDASVEVSRAALEAVGFSFVKANVAGNESALRGHSEADQSGPSLVLLPTGTRTLVLLSYDAGLEELTAFASGVKTVSKADWIAAGGVVR